MEAVPFADLGKQLGREFERHDLKATKPFLLQGRSVKTIGTGLPIVLAIVLWFPQLLPSQEVRGGGNPYSSQLITDPDAGTVQGIQRYGRPLSADPAQGNGYPYFVFPSVRNTNQPSPFSGSPTINLSPGMRLQAQRQLESLNSVASERISLAQALDQKIKAAERGKSPNVALDALERQSYQSLLQNQVTSQSLMANPMIATQQIVNRQDVLSALQTGQTATLSVENARKLLGLVQDPAISISSAYVSYAAPVFVPTRGLAFPADKFQAYISHQPLIQIKLRVVEISRDNTVSSGSTLDYIRRRQSVSEFVTNDVPNVNNLQIPQAPALPQNRTSTVSRFGANGLIGVGNAATNLSGITGAGALVNLTGKHINWIASLLATELEADVLTAPELVTTNGEGVEFVAGSKTPLNLGSVDTTPTALSTNLTSDNPNRKNSVFYKHIGTYLKVTPRIVNYAASGKGRGESPVVAADVRDWNALIKFLLNEQLAYKNSEIKDIRGNNSFKDTDPHIWEPYTRSGRLVPLEVKTQVLACMNRFTKSDLQTYAFNRRRHDPGFEFDFLDMVENCEDEACEWNPEDCTIDIEVVARFSSLGTGTTERDPFPRSAGTVSAAPDLPAGLTAETDVRAIANILQIKNGTGLVMAGLLGESDIEAVSKVPIVGDLPVVGFLFRSKSVSRKKSEILIFIEANVLSPTAEIAREESSSDLLLAKPYVVAGTLDNPLELGLYRAGFGNYLPPSTHQEDLYWARRAQHVNRVRTEIQDALR